MSRKLILMLLFCLLIQSFVTPCNAENFRLVDENSVTLFVPAVEKTDHGYRGVLATLTVMVKKGKGHVFVDTLPLTEIDTQSSARMAKEAVEEVLGKDLDNYDLYFVIRSDAPIVGGPSAGGAMAVGILAAVLNLTVDKSVIMTGTINIDGSIGPVGGLLEKCQAAAEHNASVFLIPQGQSVIYVEKTQSESFPGGISIITTTPVKINLVDYAREKWNVSVKEVENVLEALKYVTGYEIRKVGKEVATKNVVEISMKNMTRNYIDEMSERLQSLKKKLERASLSFETHKQLDAILKEQEDELKKARELFEDKNYYSASSTCFGIEIKLNYVENVIEFAKSGDSDLVAENLIRSIENKINNISSQINAAKNEIDNVADVEIVSVALDRLGDAEKHLREAWKNYYNTRYYDAIYYASYAGARANSSLRWLSLSKEFKGEKMEFDFSKLQHLARRRIDDASTFITYAQLLGVGTQNAEDSLENAKREYERGNYASALFDAVAAKAMVDVELLTRNLDKSELSNRIDAVEESAIISINDAEREGAIPIVGISYYEYAKNLEDIKERFLYFVYAKYFARLSKSLLKVMNESYEEGETVSIEIVPSSRSVESCAAVEYFAAGAVAGCAVSLAAVKLAAARKKPRIARRRKGAR